MGDGVAHLHLAGILDATDDVAHIARTEFLAGYHVHLEHTNLIGIVLHTRIEELHEIALTDHAIDNLEIGNDASEGVKHGVKDESLQRSLLIAFGMGYALYDGIKDLLYALTRLA